MNRPLAALAVTVIAHCCALVFRECFYAKINILLSVVLIKNLEKEKSADPGHPPDELKET